MTENAIANAWRALGANDVVEAERQALAVLGGAVEGGWDFGNRIHHGHLILGHVRLRQGDIAGAERELIEAGRSPGSPQLDSFGPNMSLALALLAEDRDATVLEFFAGCAQFWSARSSRLPMWQAFIEDNEIPNFGPNLFYGMGEAAEIWTSSDAASNRFD